VLDLKGEPVRNAKVEIWQANTHGRYPTDVAKIQAALLDAFDRQRQVDLAARLVARHLKVGHSPQEIIVKLARAVLRKTPVSIRTRC
jgi:hypothetical protein